MSRAIESLVIVLTATLLVGTSRQKPAEAPPVRNASPVTSNLQDRSAEHHALASVMWGTPAVNFDGLYQAVAHGASAGEGSNKVVYWSRLPAWKNRTLSSHPDSIYFMSFLNTKDVGPIVLEIPPAGDGSITGWIDDCWQTAIQEVGLAGADKGRGARYLLLPPGYEAPAPSGYFPLRSYTYEGYAILRSTLKSNSEAGLAQAVAYGKRIRIYPLSQAAHPPATQFFDAIDVVYDATLPWDLSDFQ